MPHDAALDQDEPIEPKPKETNIEFLTRFMEFSFTGVTAQLVAMTAMDYYTRAILEKRDEVIRSMERGPVSGRAWIAACEEYQRMQKERGITLPLTGA